MTNSSSGMFRRRIIINSGLDADGMHVRAALEDDFHHFRVEIAVEQAHVSRITGHTIRHPYTMCSQAIERLQELVGTPVTPIAHGVTRITDPTEQCTHLLELSGLAMAASTRTPGRRQYDVDVQATGPGATHSTLRRDGMPLLDWHVQDTIVQTPAPYAGRSIYEGMAGWAISTLPEEEAEAALVLRRATGIAKGRAVKLDVQIHAIATGRCFAQQSHRAEQAFRIVGSTWDFTASPGNLCSIDLSWVDAVSGQASSDT